MNAPTEVPIEQLQHYAFLDPASGKQVMKRVLARSAIVVVGVDALTRIFVRYAWADRVSPSKILDKVFEVNDRFKPRRFGCEANAQQSLFAGSILHDAKWRNKRIPISPIYQPTNLDKDFRIRTLIQPVMAQGRLFLADEHYELKLEVQSFPLSALKDLIDALASVIDMVPKQATGRQNTAEIEELAAHLRASGVPPHLIERRINEVLRGL